MIYVVKEQIYRNINTGEIAQIRQEMSNGTVQWQRQDGSIWDSHIDDPNASLLLKTRDPIRK